MSKIKGLFEIYNAQVPAKDDKNFLPPEFEVQVHDDKEGNGADIYSGSRQKYAGQKAGQKPGADLKAAKKFDKGDHQVGEAHYVTKESIIDNVFDTYITPRVSQIDPDGTLSENISALPTRSQEMIYDLYESLDAVNRSALVNLSETVDGINQIIDFILTGGIDAN